MSAILFFFSYLFEKKIMYTIQKRQNFACNNYIFPKTKGKQEQTMDPLLGP